MKAQYKGNGAEDDLIVGKKYDVIDVKCKKGFEVSEIYIKNDSGEECWYNAEHFIMYAEATAAMKMAAVEGALAAGAMATPEPQKIIITTADHKESHTLDMIEKTLQAAKMARGLMYGA